MRNNREDAKMKEFATKSYAWDVKIKERDAYILENLAELDMKGDKSTGMDTRKGRMTTLYGSTHWEHTVVYPKTLK